MGSFRVVSEGPMTRPLPGTVHVGGAKNRALKLMAAALLAPGRSMIHNVPDILDVDVMGQLLRELGCERRGRLPDDSDPTSGSTAGRATIDVPEELEHQAPYDLVRRLRASITVLGPLVARCGRAERRPARRGRHRVPRARHAHPRAAGARAPSYASSTGRSWPRCRDGARRRQPVARLPVASERPRTW